MVYLSLLIETCLNIGGPIFHVDTKPSGSPGLAYPPLPPVQRLHSPRVESIPPFSDAASDFTKVDDSDKKQFCTLVYDKSWCPKSWWYL